MSSFYSFVQPHALLSKINAALSAEEQKTLSDITAGGTLSAHILPIRSVGVQVISQLPQVSRLFDSCQVLLMSFFNDLRVTADPIATCVLCHRTRIPTGTNFSSWPKSYRAFVRILTG